MSHPPSEAGDGADLALVEQCLAGDEAACRRLYLRHAPIVYRWARRLGVSMSELPDVTQEVFSKAFRNLHRFERGQLAHWLSRLTTNVVNDHHRRRRVREAFRALWHQPEATARNPEQDVLRAQAESQVSEILGRMRPKHREVFVLFELERLSGDQIAERLQVPQATVRTRLFHARRAFLRIGQKRGLIARDLKDDDGGNE